MRTNFLTERSYQIGAKIHEASILLWAVARLDVEGKRTSQVCCDYYLPIPVLTLPLYCLRQSETFWGLKGSLKP